MVKWIISGRRWFDKVNGNTYHSVSITDAKTNRRVYNSGMTYGYGDAYRQTAKEYLTKKGRINKKTDGFDWAHKNIYYDVSDVSSQKDLDKETVDTLKDKKDVIMTNQMYDKDLEMRQHLHRQKMQRKMLRKHKQGWY